VQSLAKWSWFLTFCACGFQPHRPPLFTIVNQDQMPVPGYLDAVWGESPRDAFATGENGRIMAFDGTLWTPMGNIPTNFTLGGVWGRGPDDVFAVGSSNDSSQGVILHFDGVTWQVMGPAVTAGLTSVWGVGDVVWAGGASGAIYQKSGSGDWQAWTPLPRNPAVNDNALEPVLWSIVGLSSTSVLAVGDELSLFYFDGAAWNSIFRPDDGHFFTTAWAGGGQFLVGGNQYALWRFTPPDRLDLLHEEDVNSFRLRGAWGSDPRHVVFVGEVGKVVTWDGQKVNPIASGITEDLEAVWGASPDDLWMVGTDGLIVHVEHLF
jgi:hypothetical protein